MNVLTVTLNAAIDQTVALEKLRPGEVHRAASVHYTAGGKGVNAAACLADFGVPVNASGFLGRENTAIFEKLFANKKIKDLFIRVDGLSRTNIKLVDADSTTDINLPGVRITPVDLAALQAILGEFRQEDSPFVAVGGSLPEGCPSTAYADIISALRPARVLLDADGAAFQAALSASVLPFCIKPNRHELSQWLGKELHDSATLAHVAKELHRRGIGLVAVSLGEEGALFVSGEGIVTAKGTPRHIASTVGAGDAMVAGILAALHENASLERIARLATAFAVTKMGVLGPNLPERKEVEASAAAVHVQWLERP